MSNRTAPVGAVVRIFVDPENPIKAGDVIETRTGRAYRVLYARTQLRGKHVGRQHLSCIVLPEDWLHHLMTKPRGDTEIHRIRWYARKGGSARAGTR